MKKHLFITGPSGCGKSTLIREVLGSRLAYAGGFITERVCDDKGNLLGYDLLPAGAAADQSLYTGMGKRFLDCADGLYLRDNEVFRLDAVEMLQQVEYYPFALVDAFGGFEVIIPQFRSALADFLNLDLPIIGVIKDAESVEQLQNRFGLGDRFPEMAAMIRRVIAADSDCEVLEMKAPGDVRVRAAVEAWVKEYLT
ncbi:MAG: hypothetical protein IJV41_07695 [Oscillospiraceae bacterium]|nr:hypothetical protein [Oscillospiraceae bacterium]